MTKVNGVLEDLIPERTSKIKICKSQPWFSDKLKTSKKFMQNRERVWQKYKQLHQLEPYKVARNKYFRLIHVIRKSYYQDEFVKHKGDSKALYNLVSKLTGTENTNILPDQPRGIELTEEFAAFFLQKIEKIQSALDGYNLFKLTGSDVLFKLSKFNVLDRSHVIKTLVKLQTKSCEVDVIPTKIL